MSMKAKWENCQVIGLVPLWWYCVTVFDNKFKLTKILSHSPHVKFYWGTDDAKGFQRSLKETRWRQNSSKDECRKCIHQATICLAQNSRHGSRVLEEKSSLFVMTHRNIGSFKHNVNIQPYYALHPLTFSSRGRSGSTAVIFWKTRVTL